MVTADCSRALSPLCETLPEAKDGPDNAPLVLALADSPEECSDTPDQQDYVGHLAVTATGKP